MIAPYINVKEHRQKSVSIRFLSFSNINFLKKYATFLQIIHIFAPETFIMLN